MRAFLGYAWRYLWWCDLWMRLGGGSRSASSPSSMRSQMDKQQARVDADRGLSIRSPFPSLGHWSVTVL
jgi:hypothetical protein